MTWPVLLHADFEAELRALPDRVQDGLLAHARLLEEFGPGLGRPRVDTLKGSKHPNMKELRVSLNHGAWRLAFAFDPQRQAVLLIAGDKSGTAQRRFYKRLIDIADARYDDHLNRLREQQQRQR
ncbi:addiction module toxin RelE [Thiohalocapsa halophila]|uniref:Addiction module toxin RelE n=1 Tax=Thiohalocapsa halophila TaxID=69359 RepID=A0ABS1CNJ6_9GAMM|nr:type II toxin-antitoxin system RelE/ParE family toxin [Thiohalocapsa halophila]MBK1633460.1 addiction module toxin RelE [Thiohalocapsa halophila]